MCRSEMEYDFICCLKKNDYDSVFINEYDIHFLNKYNKDGKYKGIYRTLRTRRL